MIVGNREVEKTLKYEETEEDIEFTGSIAGFEYEE
jgi:hypothetical protein